MTITFSHASEFSEQNTFKAGKIEASATMLDHSNITYQAGTEISLVPGFTVELGAQFSAEIVPCASGTTWVYQYAITDHLGNNRLLFADLNDNGSVEASEILQENHYYAFGMEMAGNWQRNNSGPEQRYRYNGKEFSEDLGLYDYGARWYDPSIARWNAVDPLAEKLPAYSTYTYTFNNPVLYSDPTGMIGESANDFNSDPEEDNLLDKEKAIQEVVERESNDIGEATNCCPGVERRARAASAELLAKHSGRSTQEEYDMLFEEDARVAGMFFEGFAFFIPVERFLSGAKWLFRIGKTAKVTKPGSIAKIINVEDGIIEVTSKFGDETVSAMSHYKVEGGKLFLNQMHIEGSKAGAVGITNLRSMIIDIGKQFNVKEVIVQGGKRTTGKFKGQTPTPRTIKVE